MTIEEIRAVQRLKMMGVAVLALVALAAACGDDDGGGNDPSTTVESTTTSEPGTTSTTLSPEEEVLRDYRASHAALTASGNPPNPQHPDLLRYFTGDALARQQSTLTQWQGLQIAADTQVESRPEVTALAGDAATVRDCFTDTTEIIDLATGQPRQSGSTTQHVDVTLQRVDGGWAVARQVERTDPCPPA